MAGGSGSRGQGWTQQKDQTRGRVPHDHCYTVIPIVLAGDGTNACSRCKQRARHGRQTRPERSGLELDAAAGDRLT